MGKMVLISGGARSGKSRFALSLGEPFSKKAFVATASPLDEEMRERIQRHQRERDPSYTTFEIPIDLAESLAELTHRFDFILVDCLTLWLTNLFLGLQNESVCEEKIQRFLRVMDTHESQVVLVSNEIGMGLVPETKLGRDFRDLQGTLNQQLGRMADEVVFMVSGVPLWVKKEQVPYESL